MYCISYIDIFSRILIYVSKHFTKYKQNCIKWKETEDKNNWYDASFSPLTL